LQEPHLEQGSESTCRRLDSLASSRTFRACSCRNRTWNRGQRVHARCWTVLHLLKVSVPAPAGTAPGTGGQKVRTCKMLDSLASSRTFRACSCRNRTRNRGQRVDAGGWTLDSLASSRTFRACSCKNRTRNRGQRVHAGGWTILHLLKPYVPAPAGTAPGTGIRVYMQDAGQSCIFQNLPCLLL
jgi:hypothetical protein